MSEIDLFGNVIYTKEELAEIKKKEEEEKKQKEEAKRQLEILKDAKTTLKQDFEELLLNDDIVNSEELRNNIEEAKNNVDKQETTAALDSLREKFAAEFQALSDKKKAEIEKKQKEEEKKKKEEEEKKAKKYKYPFLMYFGHEYRDVSGVFEEGKEYTEKQLTKTLVDHGYKDFKYAQEIQWEYFEDENCLYPKFKLGNRG